MNRKGFTLIEMITTIAILLLITVIAVPSVTSLLSKSDDKLDKAVKKQLISYAKSYMKDKEYLKAIDPGKKYCLLINDITEENFVNQDNDEITGRIEIVKTGEDVKYTYSETNNLDGCEELPNISIVVDDEPLYLTSNSDPDIDPDTLKGTLIEKYDYTDEVPDFKIKSPNEIPSGNYNKKIITYSSDTVRTKDYYNGKTSNPITLRPYNSSGVIDDTITYCGNNFANIGTDKFNGLNVKKYFGKSYEFNTNTGVYTLKHTINGYGSDAKPLENGYKYICQNGGSTCETMYEITDYSCYKDTFIYRLGIPDDYGCWREVCYIKKGYKYNKKYQVGEQESTLHRTFVNGNPIYYFRGAVTNNYVKFQDSNILFQISRFNSDNSIRLVSKEPIYNDDGKTIKEIAYDGSPDDYRMTYKIGDNGSSSSVISESDFLSKYSNLTVYNNAQIPNEFVSEYTTSNADTVYTTFDKCFSDSSTKLCENKYIKDGNLIKKIISTESMINSAHRKVYIIEWLTLRIWENKIKYYGDSILLKELKSWYNKKLKNNYDDLITTGEFCYEKTESKLDPRVYYPQNSYKGSEGVTSALFRLDYDLNKISPTFSCSNSFKSKVGTLTADEVIFAGAVSDSQSYVMEGIDDRTDKNDINPFFFLYRPTDYLTLTYVVNTMYKRGDIDPNYSFRGVDKFGQSGKYIYSFYTNNVENHNNNIGVLTYSNNSSFPVYPVINVTGDIKFTGTGTKTDPFIILKPINEELNQ